ncbi:MAG: pimeloyl-ACP methyl ester esterase BioH [Steroidobacteraceae bacterium]
MNVGAAPHRIVMLHGWGLNGAVFDRLATQLAPRFDVLQLDLPGHGRSTADVAVLEHGIDALAAQLAAELDATWPADGVPLHLLGWSLGGMAALALATAAPRRFKRLTLLASTPCFVARDGWPHGLAAAVLEQFAAHLRHDHRRTVHEFLELQVRGSAQAGNTLRGLQAALDARGAATTGALAAGLELLRTTDLRDRLGVIDAPVLVIGGQYDRVTPPWAMQALATALPRGEYREIARAGHAPFLSHPQQVTDWLLEGVDAR